MATQAELEEQIRRAQDLRFDLGDQTPTQRMVPQLPAQQSPGPAPLTMQDLNDPSRYYVQPGANTFNMQTQQVQMTPQERAVIQANQEARAFKLADQLHRKDHTGRGSGLIGAMMKRKILKERPQKIKDTYLPRARKMIEQETQVEQVRNAIERRQDLSDEQQMTLFNKSLDTMIERDTRGQDRTWTLEDQASDVIREDLLRREDIQREDQLRTEDRIIELEDRYEARDYDQDVINEERVFEQLTAEDEGARIMAARLKELRDYAPLVARMAGKKVPTNKDGSPLRRGETWSWWKRATGGTGPMAQYFWNTRDDTQMLARLANTEAINAMNALEQPLTPMSDKDVDLMFGLGVSEKNNESVNYQIILEAIEALENELEIRARRMTGVRQSNLSPMVDSIVEITPGEPRSQSRRGPSNQ